MKRGRKRVTTERRIDNFVAWLALKSPGPKAIVARFGNELKAHAASLARLERHNKAAQ